MDLTHIESKLGELLRHTNNLVLIQGELIDRWVIRLEWLDGRPHGYCHLQVASNKILEMGMAWDQYYMEYTSACCVKLIAEQGASLTERRITSTRCSIDYSHSLGSAL